MKAPLLKTHTRSTSVWRIPTFLILLIAFVALIVYNREEFAENVSSETTEIKIGTTYQNAGADLTDDQINNLRLPAIDFVERKVLKSREIMAHDSFAKARAQWSNKQTKNSGAEDRMKTVKIDAGSDYMSEDPLILGAPLDGLIYVAITPTWALLWERKSQELLGVLQISPMMLTEQNFAQYHNDKHNSGQPAEGFVRVPGQLLAKENQKWPMFLPGTLYSGAKGEEKKRMTSRFEAAEQARAKNNKLQKASSSRQANTGIHLNPGSQSAGGKNGRPHILGRELDGWYSVDYSGNLRLCWDPSDTRMGIFDTHRVTPGETQKDTKSRDGLVQVWGSKPVPIVAGEKVFWDLPGYKLAGLPVPP